MLDYLWELMVQGQYARCLSLAQGELLGSADSLASLARLNYIIFFCRMQLGDPAAAVGSGMLALTLARKVGDTELEASALVNLGWAYTRGRRYEEALSYFYGYLALFQATGVASHQITSAWRGIGVTLSQQHRAEEAAQAFERLVPLMAETGCRIKLANAKLLLLSARLEAARSDRDRCLAGVLDLLRAVWVILKNEPQLTAEWASYQIHLGQYYLLAKRHKRAMVVASRALAAYPDDKLTQYGCHMILYHAYRSMGRFTDALGHAVAARMAATDAKRYDLEFEAAERVVEVLKERGPGVVHELDRQYQDMGIDLGQFILLPASNNRDLMLSERIVI